MCERSTWIFNDAIMNNECQIMDNDDDMDKETMPTICVYNIIIPL